MFFRLVSSAMLPQRRTFFSTNISLFPALKLDSIQEFESGWKEEFAPLFEKNGFLLLELRENSTQSLLKIANLMGPIQGNRSTTEEGISDIISEKASIENNRNVVLSSLAFLPHTDGAYLRSVSKNASGDYFQISPPRLLILQSVEPALRGGETLLYDGRQSLHRMLRISPESLKFLFDQNCMNLLHNGIDAIGVPVCQRIERGCYTIRYSYDSELYFAEKFRKPLEIFNTTLSPCFNQKLETNQMLIIDNLRILHARAKVFGNRSMRRIWIGQQTEQLFNIEMDEPLYTNSHAIIKSHSYNKLSKFFNIEKTSPSKKSLDIKTGIRVSEQIDKRIRDLLFEDEHSYKASFKRR